MMDMKLLFLQSVLHLEFNSLLPVDSINTHAIRPIGANHSATGPMIGDNYNRLKTHLQRGGLGPF